MPVQHRGSAGAEARAIILAFVGVAVALGLLFLFARAGTGDGSGPGGFEVTLGDESFDAGDVTRISEEIADRGPILYSDVAGGTRDIILIHLGSEPDEGWEAFAAQRPGSPRDCFLAWETTDGAFRDTCDDTTVPADGGDLPRYEVEVTNDRVIVHINELVPTDDS